METNQDIQAKIQNNEIYPDVEVLDKLNQIINLLDKFLKK